MSISAYLTKRRILLILVLLLNCTYYFTNTNSLECYCNICANDTCQTSPDKESACYKSVRPAKYDNGTSYLEATYGCISASEGSINHFQCLVSRLKNAELVYMECCRSGNSCNYDLPDPNEDEDPRWKLVDNGPPDARDIIQLDSWQVKLCIVAVGVFFMICTLIRLVKIWSSHTKDNISSSGSLKASLDRYHQNVASISISTHSCSISDDLCHKTTSDPADSYIYDPVELTSGEGDHNVKMLNQRTMARAVGFGKTEPVGNGRFGRVFKGLYRGEDVAVKAFRIMDQDSWEREEKTLKRLNHENIVRFIASEVTSLKDAATEIWMFLEYCPYGSLCDYLDHNEVQGPQHAVKILYCIINGLDYLHVNYAQQSASFKPSVAHRDIKSKNILMKTSDCCCIADFGHALIKIDEGILDYGNYNRLQVGTIRYMAPEILKLMPGVDYRCFTTFAQADLYQFGLVLWEVCHRTELELHPPGPHKLPYDGVVPHNPDMQDMIKIVFEDQYRPPRYEKWFMYPIMDRLAELMVECWRHNPKARMETLGVKKKLKSIYDKVMPPPHQQYHANVKNFSLSPNHKSDRDRTRSIEATM